MTIGILDSGVGGLTVWREIVALLPGVSTIYVGDSKNCPYGTKSEEEIWTLTQRLIEFLQKQQVSVIVIACNTISVTALERARRQYPEITFVGTVPAIKTAVAQSKEKRIGILSTLRTASSEYQKKRIEEFAADCYVLNIGTDKLVPLVEREELSGERVTQTLEETLQPFLDARIDTLVLGCTHFPFLKSEMQIILGDQVRILDSGEAIARQVKRVLAERSLDEGVVGKHQFFTSGDPEQLNRLLRTQSDSVTISSAQPLL